MSKRSQKIDSLRKVMAALEVAGEVDLAQEVERRKLRLEIEDAAEGAEELKQKIVYLTARLDGVGK